MCADWCKADSCLIYRKINHNLSNSTEVTLSSDVWQYKCETHFTMQDLSHVKLKLCPACCKSSARDQTCATLCVVVYSGIFYYNYLFNSINYIYIYICVCACITGHFYIWKIHWY